MKVSEEQLYVSLPCRYSSILYHFESFDVEEYRNLEVQVMSHSRSSDVASKIVIFFISPSI